MGFLSFRKKSKANKAVIPPSPPPPLVLNDDLHTTTTTTGAGSDYHSPIADFFMMELVPLSIISNTTRSSKQSDSSDSSLTSLSSTEEFVPLYPISRSDPRQYANKKKVIASTTPPATTASVPELAMARMKERHRQEYRRSMQWSPPTHPSPNAPSSSAAAMMEYHPSSSKRDNSFSSQRTHSMQHQLPPRPPSSAPLLVHARVQVPLINQINTVVVPIRSMSSSTYTSKPFDRRPLIASIPPPISYQQPKPAVVPVPDHRHYHLVNQVQHPSSTAAMQRQAETQDTTDQTLYAIQRLAGITQYQYQQQQQQTQEMELSKSSKLKTDYRRIVCTRKQDYVPDLIDLLDHQEEQQQHPVDHKSSSSHCSLHQPHHTMIERQYNNTDGYQQQKQQQYHYPSTHRCNHHHHYTHWYHRKPATCCNTCC